MVAITANSTSVSDEIIRDKHALEIKQKIMERMRNYSLLNNISEASKFIAAPLFTIGATLLVTALAGTAAPALATVGGIMLGVATAVLGVAVATGYAASRVLQSTQFDNFEINAESTARHLVREMKTSRTTITEEHTQNVRADGKKWVQVVTREPDQQQIMQQPQNQG